MKIIKRTNGTMAMKLDGSAKNNNKAYNLAAGDPNLNVSENFKSGMIEAIREDIHQYGEAQGLLELRKKFGKPDKVLISNGAKQLIYLSLYATCKPNDTVLIIGPCWSSYLELCRILKLQIVQYIPKNKWTNNIEDIKFFFKKYNPEIVLYNNPNNPTGAIDNKNFVFDLIDLCESNNCWLLSDEIYDKIIYDNIDFFSCLNLSKNVIYINGFSKCYGLTGWRFGYCIADEELIEQMTLLQSQISGPPNTLIQTAILKGFNSEYLDIDIFQRRRDYLCSINSLFELYKPQGGFYFYLPVKNSLKLCEDLKKKNIIITPGDDYGVSNTVRISFANINLNSLMEIESYLKIIS